MTEKEFVLKFVANTCGCIDLTSSKAAESVTELIKYAGEVYHAINGSNKEPEKKEEPGDYQDELDLKCRDKIIEHYRKHKDEIDKVCKEEFTRTIFPFFHSRRFDKSNDPEEIQECIDTYEARIDELTEQYNKLYLRLEDITKERDEARIEKRDDEARWAHDAIEKNCTIQELRRRVQELISERDKAMAELTDIKSKLTKPLDLSEEEVVLLNTLRLHNACAVFIKKDKGNSKWKAEYLVKD